jgi:hypothetical protein
MTKRTEGDSVRRKIGDRRIRPRFDIVGDLWGSLETVLRLPLRNVSRGGALIHSHVPLPPQSVHRIALQADGQELSVPCACHMWTRGLGGWRADVSDRCRIHLGGPALLQFIDRLLMAGQGEGAGA